MTEDSQASLMRALRTRLLNGGEEIWSNRVFSDLAKTGTPYPYVVFAWSGGGEVNQLRKMDAEYVYTVRCIADEKAVALAGAGRIAALLNDADDYTANRLTSTDWTFNFVTQEGKIDVVEGVDAGQIYHNGGYYRIHMEVI